MSNSPSAMSGRKKPDPLNMVPEAPGAEASYFAAISDSPVSRAFSRKVSVHAGMGGVPVPREEIPALQERLRAGRGGRPAAAYVHLPYCENKCLYCGFFGGKYTENAGAVYLEALVREIELERAYCNPEAPINALYLGGGTPTAMQPDELLHLLQTLKQVLPLANDCEITVEGRIHNFEPKRIEACLEGGANRFSIGIQSFNTEIRRRLGRISTKEDIIRNLRFLARYNQAALIIDLIYGLPGQSLTDWEDDIRTFLDLPLDGVDLYQLNIFPGSALSSAIDTGRVPPAASLPQQGAFFERGVALMQGARCRRLSMSHWGRTARERNIYNPLAKKRADCLQFGAGAGGVLQGWSMFNHPKVEQYLQCCNAGEKPVAMMAAPSPDMSVVRVILEQMEFCRLNLNDVDAAFAGCTGRNGKKKDAHTLYAPLLDNWKKAGLVTQDGPWVELSLAGQFWQVNLTQALIGWQRQMGKE